MSKTPQKIAKTKLIKQISTVYKGAFKVTVESDDGGSHLCLYIETDGLSDNLPQTVKDCLPSSYWLDWRLLVMRCPPGWARAPDDEVRN